MGEVRRFDGKIYTRDVRFEDYKKSKEYANGLRADGYKVRIVERRIKVSGCFGGDYVWDIYVK